jgi:BirA family biotin operon repressor/biotin-[acetyl-CoA-carboxylase] ligase
MTNLDLESLADKILLIIRRHPGSGHKTAKLARKLGVEEQNIIAAIGLLKNLGYSIHADRDKSYSFVAPPDNFLAAEILNGLETKFIGRRIYSYQSVQSTNVIAAQLAAARAPEGTIVIAEHQTRGRGRLGRNWYSPEKVGLYCSIILYPKIHPTLAPGISIMAAVAVAETIASYDDMDISIKWPNDVLIAGQKVAGILTELSAEIDRVDYVIVGIGVNINQKKSDFPEELKKTATSVRIGAKEKINRAEFLHRLLKNIEIEYNIFRKIGLKEARKKLIKLSFLHHKEIRLKLGRKIVAGTVIDIDESGRLVLDTKDGIMNFNAGEATTR